MPLLQATILGAAPEKLEIRQSPLTLLRHGVPQRQRLHFTAGQPHTAIPQLSRVTQGSDLPEFKFLFCH